MKDKFKTEELLQRVVERKSTVQPLNREIQVFVEKIRPVYEGPQGERRGPPRVKVVLSRGKGFVSLTTHEAELMVELISDVLEKANAAEAVCAEEKKAWIRREDEKNMYQPGPGVGVMNPGKTNRDRLKKKAKAGGQPAEEPRKPVKVKEGISKKERRQKQKEKRH